MTKVIKIETKGWVLTRGDVGSKVDPYITIFSSKSCLTVLRTEHNNDRFAVNITGLSKEEIKEAVKKAKAEKEAYLKAYKAYNNQYKLLQADYMKAKANYNNAYNAYVHKIFGESDSDIIDIEKFNIDDYNTTKEYDEVTKLSNIMNEKKKVMDDYSKSFHDKWGTETATVEKEKELPPIIASQKQLEEDIDNLGNKINSMDANLSATSQLTAWFDAMEKYIDSMPQFKENTLQLYEVEQRGTDWYYTGAQSVPDPEMNRRLREWKMQQCKKLNNMIESTTDKLSSTLNRMSKKCVYIYPLINIVKTLTGGISLSTVVKFVKSLIDFCMSIYQMIYKTYKTIIALIEIVVVRFPQLISKLMNKVTELDCSVEVKSVKVNFPKNDGATSKSKKK